MLFRSLSTCGIRVDASQFLQNLVSLSKSGLVIHDAGRWRLAEYIVRPERDRATPMRKGDDEVLRAVVADVRPLRLAKSDSDGSAPETESFEWSALLRYYAATQRQDPRGQIEEFADRHERNWQLIRATGLWWLNCEMTVRADHLAATFRESL